MTPGLPRRSPGWKPSTIPAMPSSSLTPKNTWRRRTGCGLKPDLGAGMSMTGLTDPQWRRHLVLHDGGRIVFRAITPNDEILLRALLGHVSKEDLRLRFFDSIKEFSPHFIAGLIELDGVRARAFVAIDEAGSEMLGVVWIIATPCAPTVNMRSCSDRISRAGASAGT